MLFSFSATPYFDFLTHFARHIDVPVKDDLLIMPEKLGQGYIRRLNFNPEFKITLHRYTLQEDLIIKRKTSGMGNELITIFFYSNEQALGIAFNDDPLVLFSERNESAVGSLGNIAKPLVKKLIAAGHEVTVISTHSDRQLEIEALGAKAALGSISDAAFLTEAFTGADAVYTMMPPAMGASNMIQNIADAGKAYAKAIKATGVPRVVMLSSVGADAPEGTGPVQGVHRVEQLLKELEGLNVTVLKSGFFYLNFLREIPSIKNRNIFGNNYDGDIPLALTHSEDLAEAIFEALQARGNGYELKYMVSDIVTGNELAAKFGEAIGKPELTWTNIPDEQLKQGMQSAGLPAELVGLIAEMGQGVRAGIITRDFFNKGGK